MVGMVVYIGAMYSLAFVSDDIEFIVAEALKTVPKESEFYRCMADVIKWHKQYLNDWKQTWFELEKKRYFGNHVWIWQYTRLLDERFERC